jgi:hypothetical protein
MHIITSNNQFGYKEGVSTADAIIKVDQYIKHAGNNAKILLMGLSKAFDTINRTLLWTTLYKKGIPEEMIKHIRRGHTGTRLAPKYKGKYGKLSENNIGFVFESGGVYPKKPDNPEIYSFISYLRNKAKKGLLKNSHLQMLTSIKFEFNGQDQQWYSKFNKVREYAMLNNGQLPRMGNRKKLKEYDSITGEWTDEKRKEEYLLGKWIMAQRTLIKNGRIKQYRKELLETIDMGIDGYERKWDETLYALYNFLS